MYIIHTDEILKSYEKMIWIFFEYIAFHKRISCKDLYPRINILYTIL